MVQSLGGNGHLLEELFVNYHLVTRCTAFFIGSFFENLGETRAGGTQREGEKMEHGLIGAEDSLVGFPTACYVGIPVRFWASHHRVARALLCHSQRLDPRACKSVSAARAQRIRLLADRCFKNV